MLKPFPGILVAGLLSAFSLYGQDPTLCTGSIGSDGVTFEDNGGTGTFSGTDGLRTRDVGKSSVPWVAVTSAILHCSVFRCTKCYIVDSFGQCDGDLRRSPGRTVSFTFSVTQFAKLIFHEFFVTRRRGRASLYRPIAGCGRK